MDFYNTLPENKVKKIKMPAPPESEMQRLRAIAET
jgi:hypothetical protein